MQGTVFIDEARLYARHGVLPQERNVGAWFKVSAWIDCDMTEAVRNDSLEGTVNYAEAFNAIKEEMSVPSALLEHVAGRIGHRLLALPRVTKVRIRLTKENPPMGANVHGAGVDLTFPRQECQSENF